MTKNKIMPDVNYSAQRRHIRFRADRGTAAKLDLNLTGEDFAPTIGAVVRDESFQGCCAVAFRSETIRPGLRCRVQVGYLHVMQARVVWVKDVDASRVSFGVEYLE